MNKFNEQQVQTFEITLQKYITINIKKGINNKMTKNQIKDYTVDSINTNNLFKSQFINKSRLENIFEDIWEDYFRND